MRQLLSNSIKKNFVVMGRAGLDLYADPPGAQIEQAQAFSSALGGSAANIAVALVRQGCKASLISAVSDDAVGRFVLRQLAHYGIDGRYVTCIGGEARTSLAVVETRNQDCQSVIYRNLAADFSIERGQSAGIDWAAYDALVVTGTCLAKEPSRSAAFAAMVDARRAGVSVVLDIDHRLYSWASAGEAAAAYHAACQASDIVVGNDEEFGVLAQGADGLDMARALARDGGRLVVYKMGAKGAVTFTKDDEFETPIFRVEALKPTGAGDAFMGGFLGALCHGQGLRAAVRHGAASAALVVTRVGCAPAMPGRAEVLQFIEEF